MSNSKLDELKNKKEENMLNEEQMENVAGGTWTELYSDAALFHEKLGIDIDIEDKDALADGLIKAWKKVGILLKPGSGKWINYYIHGSKLLSREEALKVLEDYVNKNR